VKEIGDIEALRWNADEISNRISLKKLSIYQNYIGSPALNKRINLLKKYLNAVT
jgi:hypothetical protein